MGSSAGKEFERVSSTKFSQRLLELNNPGCFLNRVIIVIVVAVIPGSAADVSVVVSSRSH